MKAGAAWAAFEMPCCAFDAQWAQIAIKECAMHGQKRLTGHVTTPGEVCCGLPRCRAACSPTAGALTAVLVR